MTNAISTMKPEVLLSVEEKRLNLLPIRYPQIWNRYKQALAALWVAGEVDLSGDPSDWAKLTPNEQHFISHVLAFFAQADGIVNDNLAERFGREVTLREAKCFYDLQKTMENVHSEMYSLLIDTVITDAAERDKLLHAIDTIPVIAKKAKWAQRWIDSSDSFAIRLIAFAVVEGIFFSGSFCSIFWLKQRGLMPGLTQSNMLISRDEGMHQEFATYLYREMLQEKVPTETIYELVKDAVDHEVEFCCDALPVSLIGMDADSMTEYIRFVADRLLTELGVEPLFHATCPFDFMLTIGFENKVNFFEQRVSEYQKVGAGDRSGQYKFSMDDEF